MRLRFWRLHDPHTNRQLRLWEVELTLRNDGVETGRAIIELGATRIKEWKAQGLDMVVLVEVNAMSTDIAERVVMRRAERAGLHVTSSCHARLSH